MTEILGFKLAPLNIPMERRIQTMVVLWYVLVFILWPYVCIALVLYLLFATQYYWISLAYIAWVFFDVAILETSARGGRRIERFRNAKIWRYFSDYFPCSLIKTGDLDPARNYILGYHPHGIIGCGVLANFASEASGFSEKFPGIKPHTLTLKSNFSIPLLRGFLLFIGMCDASKESIKWILTKQGKGNAAVIVIGGAKEALESRPGTYKLTMLQRKGFVKIAIQTGADLVPTYSFGENDLYQQADNPAGSWLRSFQEKFKRVTGISPPIFYGRGVFNYTFGMLPYRHTITSVVGTPIRVEQNAEAPIEMIDEYHAKYLEALSKLFDENKEKYGIDKDKKLEFIA